MNCRIKLEDDYTLIRISENLETMEDCRTLLATSCAALDGESDTILVDLSQADYVRLSFCGYLVSLYKKAKADGKILALIVPPRHLLHKVLSIAGIHRMVDIYPSLDLCLHARACGAFRASPSLACEAA